MKRLVLLILVLLVFVDLTEDGCLGKVKFGPLQAAVNVAFSILPHQTSRQVDSSHSPQSPDRRVIFSLRQYQPIMEGSQQTLKIIISCNNGGSGGIPQ
jgi:hypothetical protein